MKNEFYVYVWEDDSGTPFYVGKGKGRRAFCRKRNEWFNRKLEKLETISGKRLEPLFYYTHLEEAQALEFEKELINKFRNQGFILTNLTDGGEGISGFRFTPESKKKISLKRTGSKASEETKLKMSESRKLRFEIQGVSGVTKQKLSNLNLGSKNSMSVLNEELVVKIYDWIIEGLTDLDIRTELKSLIGADVDVSSIRRGITWKHLYDTHIYSKIGYIGSCQKTYDDHGGRERVMKILEAIESGASNKELMENFGFKFSGNITPIRMKRSWKNAWKIYELQRLSKRRVTA